jgi:hypothetical protein
VSVVVGDIVTVVWISGLRGHPTERSRRVYAIGKVTAVWSDHRRKIPGFVFRGVPGTSAPDAAGALYLDGEGSDWIRGHHEANSKEVAALFVAHALGSEA